MVLINKTRAIRILTALLLGSLAFLAACSPPQTSGEAQAVLYAGQTQLALTSQALAATLAAPQVPTPVPSFAWAGDWQVYETLEAERYGPYTMSVTVIGRAFSAAITMDGAARLSLEGTLSEDGLSAAGTYTSAGIEGSFSYTALGTAQFQGSGFQGGETWGWCGAREGAEQPDPCFKP